MCGGIHYGHKATHDGVSPLMVFSIRIVAALTTRRVSPVEGNGTAKWGATGLIWVIVKKTGLNV